MTQVRTFQVDAFTARPSCGNPASVVLDADALSSEQMLQLARSTPGRDSAFLLAPEDDDYDLRVRFFTPSRETGFIGHATLAAHAVLATLDLPPRPRQQHQGGSVTVDRVLAGSPPRIAIHQSASEIERALPDAELTALLRALALPAAALDTRCQPAIVGAVGTRVLLGVRDAGLLERLQPDMAALTALSGALGVPGYFVYTLHPQLADVYTEARMFCPALGIPEDPVSGNAHALLGAYLIRHRLIGAVPGAEAETIEFCGAQGHHMGRPGRVSVALSMVQDVLQSVTITGEAVVVSSATMRL
jgi:PhzF family phenazine biosynthesis protein